MLILAGTPIGNLGDASTRLVEALTAARYVAAEDTRVTRQLLRALGIDNRPTLYALHDHNERERSVELIELAREGDLLMMSDAGMPTVSDPGYHLVEAAIAAGITVTALPGPSAVVMALAVSGLPTDRFSFEGFLPRKRGERLSIFRALTQERRTMVFFESPHRIGDALADLVDTLGPQRRVVVCRELTKMFEEVRRGTAVELAEWAAGGLRGEICLVVAGAPARVASLEEGLLDLLARVAAGAGLKEASAEVADRTGLSRRALYEAALAARRSPPGR
ncbi:16S rRNA (cytidine(1402)-2'-O)-methyltransferase [Rathayibacter toxicus]|uniref:Ribosomal RNA small subunit methyltransferase I n=1 Tax=Rathayibacter toxicus TaxID=145458 RepID=A0A0C5BE55_9MICO|nr:16S rRNA (cytidine(1402)-2'-O)-methyltransferase [Rathayibacter toxicus]AJM77299.1 16S rRNA methyltransferase [Rathayibacter toxicus]ALS56832.1 16S rRNA methyltransferase [Rathayibacter toxicus]KKM46325.1 16S rRNA methyltransferase [Rathayibacter toxicus]PPG23304.1 16S rRNA (cytidine(1402)-2'-O)-methyltransferase [Rathayibacter toxicus]PPG47887.1 16S rRNA (cytidine(1402)-2'-O)-methyltransferase [Rathayibacter toxicus]